MDILQDYNGFIICGPIVKKTVSEMAVNYVIKTPRFNMPNVISEGTPGYSYPEVSFYKADLKEMANQFKEGDIVKVKGTIYAKNRQPVTPGQNSYVQTLTGISLEKCTSDLATKFGIDLGKYVTPINDIFLVGRVANIMSPAKGVIRINIQTYVDGYLNNIQTFTYRKNTQNILNALKRGDRICARGFVQTVWKEKENDTSKFYRNIVLQDFVKLEQPVSATA